MRWCGQGGFHCARSDPAGKIRLFYGGDHSRPRCFLRPASGPTREPHFDRCGLLRRHGIRSPSEHPATTEGPGGLSPLQGDAPATGPTTGTAQLHPSDAAARDGDRIGRYERQRVERRRGRGRRWGGWGILGSRYGRIHAEGDQQPRKNRDPRHRAIISGVSDVLRSRVPSAKRANRPSTASGKSAWSCSFLSQVQPSD
jgi:hypothetical protein